jgi:hypothetical protein
MWLIESVTYVSEHLLPICLVYTFFWLIVLS